MSENSFVQISFGAATDVGKRRSENEDSFLVDFDRNVYPGSPALFVVCDGVGGALAGKTASSLAAEQVAKTFRARAERDLPQRLVAAAEQASAVILDRSLRDPATEGMATTLVAAAFDGAKCDVVNVGDSRAYLISQGRIGKITTDHTLIQDQLTSGIITQEQAANSPYRHVITRSLGRQSTNVGAETYTVALHGGEVFVLCSDGLTDMVSEAEIRDVAGNRAPEVAAQALVNLANAHGGHDNVTVIVVRVGGDVGQSDRH